MTDPDLTKTVSDAEQAGERVLSDAEQAAREEAHKFVAEHPFVTDLISRVEELEKSFAGLFAKIHGA